MNFSRTRALRLGLTASLLLGATSLAGAQGRMPDVFGGGGGGSRPDRRPVRVLIGGGLTVPTGGAFKDLHQNGFHFDGALIVKLPGLPLAVRPQLSVASFQYKRRPNPGPISTPVGLDVSKTRLFTGLGNIELPFGPGFYAIGGVGAINLNTDFAGDTLSNAKGTNLIMDVGAGFRFEFGGIQGFLEARVGSASFDKQKLGYERTQFVPISFGFVF